MTIGLCDKKYILDNLTETVGLENVTIEECDLICYDKDFSISSVSKQFIPDFVIHSETTKQVSEIVKIANKHKIPLIPRGGGTGIWGGAIPINGGILLDIRKMDRIFDVDEENRTRKLGRELGDIQRNLSSQSISNIYSLNEKNDQIHLQCYIAP